MRKPYSNVLVALLKGIIYRHQQILWTGLIQHQVNVRDYFRDVFLELIIDESEGFGYLKQNRGDEEEEEETKIPKLISKRQLSAQVSLLCLILRRDIIENDREGSSLQAYKTKQEIIEELKSFYPATTDEGKQLQKIHQTIKAVEDEGFLRKLQHDEETYEIMRIIKAFIPAEVVSEKLEQIRIYLQQKPND